MTQPALSATTIDLLAELLDKQNIPVPNLEELAGTVVKARAELQAARASLALAENDTADAGAPASGNGEQPDPPA